MRPLNNIQEQVERSIEWALYQVLVTNGYTPDRVIYANNPGGYTTALKSIQTTKGFAIELFGHGVSHDREMKMVPRIVINGLGFDKGDTGNAFEPMFEVEGDGFNRVRESLIFSCYKFEIIITSNKTTEDRVLEAVRQSALPNLGYIDLYGSTSGEKMLVELQYSRPMPDLISGLIQKTYSYEAKDIKEQSSEVMQSGISKIKEITVTQPPDQLTPFIYKKANTLIVNEGVATTEDSDTILN